jgi:protein-disulfide isomerase
VKDDVLNDQLESILATPPVPVEVPADAPVIGDPNAAVTVVKFSDYECPACKLGATSIHPLFKRYPKQVKFVFLNFPLATECNADTNLKRTIHPFACEAAAVAVCASQQGKFAETYETLFENQSSFEAGKIADLLGSKVQGIDLPRLKDCMKLPSTGDKIRRDSQVGVNLKVQSTPTFFVNGKRIEGGIPTRIWIKVLEKMLAP